MRLGEWELLRSKIVFVDNNNSRLPQCKSLQVLDAIAHIFSFYYAVFASEELEMIEAVEGSSRSQELSLIAMCRAKGKSPRTLHPVHIFPLVDL